MIPTAFDYRVAKDLQQATAMLHDFGEDSKIIAGGMSLIPLMKMRLAQPSALIDIGRLTELNYVRLEGDRLRIGALTRHVDLARDHLVRAHLPLLARMAGEVGDAQVRARGTLGGVLAHADSAGDYCTLAVMLDAEIVTSRRRMGAVDFLVDFMTTPLSDDEVVVEINFPVQTGAHDYVKSRRRRSDWAIVGIAAQETSDGWRVGLTNVASTAIRSSAAESALAAEATAVEVSVAMAEDLAPIGDFTTPANYKKWLARVLAERMFKGLGVA